MPDLNLNPAWYVFFVLAAFAVVYMTERKAKTRVRYYLEDRGFEDVIVKTRLFAGGKGIITFDVEYTTTKGIRKKNSCVVHTGIFSDEKIYWQHSFERRGIRGSQAEQDEAG